MAEIFRQQAVEHHRSGRTGTDTAEPGSFPRIWALLCGLVVLGLAGAAMVPVPRYVQGNGVATTDREITVEVPGLAEGAPAVLQQGTVRGRVGHADPRKAVVRLDIGTVQPGSRYQVSVRVGFRSILGAL